VRNVATATLAALVVLERAFHGAFLTRHTGLFQAFSGSFRVEFVF
jgi:hypothetical protein